MNLTIYMETRIKDLFISLYFYQQLSFRIRGTCDVTSRSSKQIKTYQTCFSWS